jgi:hypothetical protein
MLLPIFIFTDTKMTENQVLQECWDRLVKELEKEVAVVKEKGTDIIPIVDFQKDVLVSEQGDIRFTDAVLEKVRNTGAVVIRNVIPRDEARQLKFELDDYISQNPQVRMANTNMYHLFWTPTQLKARAHPNMIALQQALMSIWHCQDADNQQVSTKYPLAFADRFRIRPPGAKMNLRPHVDGGFIGTNDKKSEFQRVFTKILQEGKWEEYDPFDYTYRLDALYNEQASQAGQGNAAFRMFQGWLSMSETGPGGGTLQVNPMLKSASAYALLRPFFASSKDFHGDPAEDDPSKSWVYVGHDVFKGKPSRRDMHLTHPHLDLDHTMVSVPQVEPGDYVAWHCDTIHAVEEDSHGPDDSSVLYIPAVPLTQDNIYYLLEQRKAFSSLTTTKIFQPPSDEGSHVRASDFALSANGLRAMGLGNEKFDVAKATSDGERAIIERANTMLFT